MNEQPANGSGDDEDPLRVLEVSRNRNCDNCWACGSTTLDESDVFPMLLLMLLTIRQVWVVLFMIVDPVETTAGML